MSDDPIGDGLAEILDADARDEILTGMLVRRACKAYDDYLDEMYPFDPEVEFARLQCKLEERERQRMETIEALCIVVGSVVIFGVLAFGAGWVMVRGWRSGR